MLATTLENQVAGVLQNESSSGAIFQLRSVKSGPLRKLHRVPGIGVQTFTLLERRNDVGNLHSFGFVMLGEKILRHHLKLKQLSLSEGKVSAGNVLEFRHGLACRHVRLDQVLHSVEA